MSIKYEYTAKKQNTHTHTTYPYLGGLSLGSFVFFGDFDCFCGRCRLPLLELVNSPRSVQDLGRARVERVAIAAYLKFQLFFY